MANSFNISCDIIDLRFLCRILIFMIRLSNTFNLNKEMQISVKVFHKIE
jgi:hypothetical protein